MPLMGSLYIGNSGLQTSQNALNTTAHNLSNVDTEGFVRQQVQQGTKKYNTIRVDPNAISNQQIGLGVNYSKVKQVRDFFLDQTYRRESGRGAFYEVSSDALEEIEKDREIAIQDFENQGKLIEAERLKTRTTYDIEMMREIGYCSGIENYSRILSGRAPGSTPYTLLDYFPKDFILFVVVVVLCPAFLKNYRSL